MAEGYHDFTAGEVLTAANLEDYCQNQGILRFASSAARDSALSGVLTEGLSAYLKDSNTLTIYTGSAWSTVGPTHGAGTSYTPTLTQSGSVSFTINNSTYTRVGRRVWWDFVLQVTGSGTGANDIVITIPVTAAYGGNAFAVAGTGVVYDASVPAHYVGALTLTSTTSMKIRSTSNTSANAYFGSFTFTAGLAVNDIVSGSITYEASADA